MAAPELVPPPHESSPAERRASANTPPPWLGAIASWIAFGLPFYLALFRLEGAPRWESDVHTVRALGVVQVGAEGVLSGALGGLFSLLPIGGKLFRLELASALLSGVTTTLLFAWARGPRRHTSPLRLLLALCAALTASLSTDWRLASTTSGSPLLAIAIALFAQRAPLSSSIGWLLQGTLLGACLVESHAVGLAGLLAAVTRAACRDELPTLRQVGILVLAAGIAGVVCLVPSTLERLAPTGGMSLGFALGLPNAAPPETPLPLFSELGWYSLVLALLGIVATGFRPSERPATAVACVWVALAIPFNEPSLRLLALAGAAVMGASGAHFTVGWLADRRLPFANLGLRLVFVLHIGVLLLGAERARQELDRRSVSATRQWTHEAFERLPAGSLLLAQDAAVAWRFWAEQASGGLRPDVLVVPRPLLAHGGLAAQLLSREPQLGPLIRDVAIQGAAGEFALSQLADARPLMVELNPSWDRRLVAHLTPQNLWLRFAPHALGSSDRDRGVDSAERSIRRVLRYAQPLHGTDWTTLGHLRSEIFDQGSAVALTGDKGVGERLLDHLRQVAPSTPETQLLVERLSERNNGLRARLQLQ